MRQDLSDLFPDWLTLTDGSQINRKVRQLTIILQLPTEGTVTIICSHSYSIVWHLQFFVTCYRVLETASSDSKPSEKMNIVYCLLLIAVALCPSTIFHVHSDYCDSPSQFL